MNKYKICGIVDKGKLNNNNLITAACNMHVAELDDLYQAARIAVPCKNGKPISLIAELRKGN
jgi:hypothetical protein